MTGTDMSSMQQSQHVAGRVPVRYWGGLFGIGGSVGQPLSGIKNYFDTYYMY